MYEEIKIFQYIKYLQASGIYSTRGYLLTYRHPEGGKTHTHVFQKHSIF